MPYSEEWLKWLRENAPKKRPKVRCNETGQMFESVAQACRILRLPDPEVYKHLRNNEDRSVRGYTFEYVRD